MTSEGCYIEPESCVHNCYHGYLYESYHGRKSPHTNAIMGESRHIIFVRKLSWAKVATYECDHGRKSPRYMWGSCLRYLKGSWVPHDMCLSCKLLNSWRHQKAKVAFAQDIEQARNIKQTRKIHRATDIKHAWDLEQTSDINKHEILNRHQILKNRRMSPALQSRHDMFVPIFAQKHTYTC